MSKKVARGSGFEEPYFLSKRFPINKLYREVDGRKGWRKYRSSYSTSDFRDRVTNRKFDFTVDTRLSLSKRNETVVSFFPSSSPLSPAKRFLFILGNKRENTIPDR